MAESTQKTAALQFLQPSAGLAGCDHKGCPGEKGSGMAKERTTRRQKDISRLLRDQKKIAKDEAGPPREEEIRKG